MVLSAIPLIVMYPFAQKFFEKGVMVGSVKADYRKATIMDKKIIVNMQEEKRTAGRPVWYFL